MWKHPKVEVECACTWPLEAQGSNLVLGHPQQRHRSGLMTYEARSSYCRAIGHRSLSGCLFHAILDSINDVALLNW